MYIVGMASICYVYVAEISDADHRGLLSSLGPVFVSLGVLIVYYLGYALDWHAVSIASALLALFTFSTVHFLPETPAWLVSHHRVPQVRFYPLKNV
jgi:SP family facilitated glucose transporter-like MFS transporter 8